MSRWSSSSRSSSERLRAEQSSRATESGRRRRLVFELKRNCSCQVKQPGEVVASPLATMRSLAFAFTSLQKLCSLVHSLRMENTKVSKCASSGGNWVFSLSLSFSRLCSLNQLTCMCSLLLHDRQTFEWQIDRRKRRKSSAHRSNERRSIFCCCCCCLGGNKVKNQPLNVERPTTHKQTNASWRSWRANKMKPSRSTCFSNQQTPTTNNNQQREREFSGRPSGRHFLFLFLFLQSTFNSARAQRETDYARHYYCTHFI